MPLVIIPLVNDPTVAKIDDPVALVKDSVDPVALVNENAEVVALVNAALVAKIFVVVAEVNTVEEARSVPGSVRVLTEDRYRSVSPNAIPALVAVEEARVRIEAGVVVPSPRRLLVLS